LSFSLNIGQTAAVQAGIDYRRGAVLVFLDGDLQNDPHDIPHLLEKIDEGYDVVSGWRRDRHDDATRVIPSKVANWVIGRVTGVSRSAFGCTLKAYRREVIQDVRLYGEMHRFIPVFAAMVGARITELPVNHRPRTYGKSKYSLSRTSRVMLDLITVKLLGSHSTKPMYFFGFAALALWAVALIFAAAVVAQKLPAPYVYSHNNPPLLLSLALPLVGVIVGMRRLSIIDIEGGHQPMSNEDSTVWVIQNGEIYNHRQLREQLLAAGHRFATKSDTEVLVHGYEEWGERMIERLNGMFAFALLDRRKASLLLARDRMGIKPLHYAIDGERFVFASELKALLQATARRKAIDPV